MALFGTPDSSSSSSQPPRQTKVSLVGEGTVFEGTIKATGDVRVSGRVLGRVDGNGKVVVAEGGVVEGEVCAQNASVAGHVRGDVTADDQLVLRETARVDGNIRADRLVVENGAVFVGECSMGGSLPERPGSSDGRAAQEEPMPEVQPSVDGPSGASDDRTAPTASDADTARATDTA